MTEKVVSTDSERFDGICSSCYDETWSDVLEVLKNSHKPAEYMAKFI